MYDDLYFFHSRRSAHNSQMTEAPAAAARRGRHAISLRSRARASEGGEPPHAPRIDGVSDLVVGRLLRATPASAAARYAEQERGGGQRAAGAQLAAQLGGRAAAAGLQLLPALEARLEAVAAVQVAQHLQGLVLGLGFRARV